MQSKWNDNGKEYRFLCLQNYNCILHLKAPFAGVTGYRLKIVLEMESNHLETRTEISQIIMLSDNNTGIENVRERDWAVVCPVAEQIALEWLSDMGTLIKSTKKELYLAIQNQVNGN